MARTTTTRLGISMPTPDTDEMVDPGVDVGTNWTKVDAAVGCIDCTEASKPGSPWDGQLIRTTDTRRVYVWNTTQNEWDLIGISLSAIGAEQVVYKTAFQDRISSTVLTDVTQLLFAGLASARYVFELTMFVEGSITADIKIGFTFPTGAGGATITWMGYGNDSAGGAQAAALFSAGFSESVTADQSLVFNAHGSGQIVRVHGYIKFGTTAGNLQTRFAQSVSNATATSIREGSYLRWTRVA